MDWGIPVVILQLIFLEGILSIDNAAVLGALVAPLPSDQPLPWPDVLAPVGRLLDPLLGKQRTAALRVGLLGAYAGRSLMLAVASLIIQSPWLKLVGAAYLIRLAFEELGSDGEEEAGEDGLPSRRLKRKAFWATVLTVELMDLAFSIDNVVAAVSLSNELWVVIVGVAIGILAMRFAAGIFSYIVEKEPILQPAAYVLILNIGMELILEDLAHVEFNDYLKFGISVTTLLLAYAYAHVPALQVFRPVLVWFSQGFAIINRFIDWLVKPLATIVRLAWHGLRTLLAHPTHAES